MARPASNIDLRMIDAGRKIIETEGVDAVTIRNVCSVAAVNSGLFNYYFSTKENFFIKLLYNIYEEFYELYNINNNKNVDPLLKLRYCLDKLLEFAIDKEKLIVSIFYDILLKNKNLLEKLKTDYLGKHILVQIIQECLDAGCFTTKLPPFEIFTMFILGGFGFQCSAGPDGYDSRSGEERAEFRKERINIILNGLLGKGEIL